MKVISLHASINTILLACILISCGLFQSNWGGPGSIFNGVSFFLGLGFILVNFKVNKFLILVFIIPFLFILMSIIINKEMISSDSMHTILLMFDSYLFLTLVSFPLDRSLMKKFVLAYLWVSMLLSFSYIGEDFLSGTMLLLANENFNGNPNSASMFFFGCLMLAIVFINGWLRWFFVASFFLLVLSTASRAGFFLAVVLLFCMNVFNHKTGKLLGWGLILKKTVYTKVLVLLIMLASIYMLIPSSFNVLATRLTVAGIDLASRSTGGHGRDEIWKSAIDLSGASPVTILFGLSPGRVAMLTNVGAHSSYVQAIVSFGWPFLIFTLFSVVFLFYFHLKKEQHLYVFFATLILVYGAFETFLFNGMCSLWWLFIFLSLYYRSFDPCFVGCHVKSREPLSC